MFAKLFWKLSRKSLFPAGSLLLSAGLLAMPVTLANPVLRDLNLGHADAALQKLDTVLAHTPNDAEALNLRCRVYYEEELWDQAISDCQAAVALDPNNSNDHLWLGRAYGQKASHVSLVAAYKLARKVAAEFTLAVQLDPKNAAALSDLGEFDVSAPAVAGGGVNRAQAVLQQLQSVDPCAALELQGRMAEEKKDYAAAENDFRFAITKSSDPAQAWMDLASFYKRRGEISQMVAAAENGAALDKTHGPALVDAATDLAEANQQPPTAIRWLNDYLNSHAQSEDAPTFAVRAELAGLLEKQGDLQAAQQQLAMVHSLASGYRVPASNASNRAAR